MKFTIYTDISVAVLTEVEADNAKEAIELAEQESQTILSSALHKGPFSVDETLGYCMVDEENLKMDEYYKKYGVNPSMRY